MDNKIQKIWEEFLNPDVMRPRLIATSLYITGFEILKDSTIGRIKDFFTHGFNEDGDIIDPKYQSDVLSRNKSILYASLDWLKYMEAIDENDINTFNRIKERRNELAHRLHHLIGSEGMSTDFEKCFQEMVSLLRKIEVWWIVNVEIPTNPDYDGKEIDEAGIVPGPVMSLQLMCGIALGSDKQRRFYYEEFKKNSNSNT